MVNLYLYCDTGLSGANMGKLTMLGAFLLLLKGPWAVLGDFNLPPAELEAAGWIEKVDGVLVVPNTTWTQQAGRVLDYAVVRRTAAARLTGIYARGMARP